MSDTNHSEVTSSHARPQRPSWKPPINASVAWLAVIALIIGFAAIRYQSDLSREEQKTQEAWQVARESHVDSAARLYAARMRACQDAIEKGRADLAFGLLSYYDKLLPYPDEFLRMNNPGATNARRRGVIDLCGFEYYHMQILLNEQQAELSWNDISQGDDLPYWGDAHFAVSPNATRLAVSRSIEGKAQISVWDLMNESSVWSIDVDPQEIGPLTFAASQDVLISTSASKPEIQIRSLSHGQPVKRFSIGRSSGPQFGCAEVRFLADQGLVACVTGDEVVLIDPETSEIHDGTKLAYPGFGWDISPSADSIVSVDDDGIAIQEVPKSGPPVPAVPLPDHNLKHVSFLDEDLLLVDRNETTIDVVRLPSGKIERSIELPTAMTAACRSGRLLVTGSIFGVVTVWDTLDGTKKASFLAHRTPVQAVYCSTDGQTAVSIGTDGCVRCWTIDQVPFPRILECPASVAGVAFSSSGEHLVANSHTALQPNHIAKRHTPVSFDTAKPGSPRKISLEPDLSNPGRGEVREFLTLHVAENGAPVLAYTVKRIGATKEVEFVSGDGRVTAELDDSDAETRENVTILHRTVAAFDSSGDLLICGWKQHLHAFARVDGSQVWKRDLSEEATANGLPDFTVVDLCRAENADITAVLGQSGKHVTTGIGEDSHVLLVDAASGEILQHLDISVESSIIMSDICTSPNGRHVFIAGRRHGLDSGNPYPGILVTIDASGNEGTLKRHPLIEQPSAIAVSRDGRTVAVGDGNGQVSLIQASTGELLCRWPAHSEVVTDLAFSRDNTMLASGSEDGTIMLWKAAVRPIHNWPEYMQDWKDEK